jgi:hypothetical protein
MVLFAGCLWLVLSLRNSLVWKNLRVTCFTLKCRVKNLVFFKTVLIKSGVRERVRACCAFQEDAALPVYAHSGFRNRGASAYRYRWQRQAHSCARCGWDYDLCCIPQIPIIPQSPLHHSLTLFRFCDMVACLLELTPPRGPPAWATCLRRALLVPAGVRLAPCTTEEDWHRELQACLGI